MIALCSSCGRGVQFANKRGRLAGQWVCLIRQLAVMAAPPLPPFADPQIRCYMQTTPRSVRARAEADLEWVKTEYQPANKELFAAIQQSYYECDTARVECVTLANGILADCEIPSPYFPLTHVSEVENWMDPEWRAGAVRLRFDSLKLEDRIRDNHEELSRLVHAYLEIEGKPASVMFRGKMRDRQEFLRLALRDTLLWADRWRDRLHGCNLDPVVYGEFIVDFHIHRPVNVEPPIVDGVPSLSHIKPSDRGLSKNYKAVMEAIRQRDAMIRCFKGGKRHFVEWCGPFNSIEEAYSHWLEIWRPLLPQITEQMKRIRDAVPWRARWFPSLSAHGIQWAAIRGVRFKHTNPDLPNTTPMIHTPMHGQETARKKNGEGKDATWWPSQIKKAYQQKYDRVMSTLSPKWRQVFDLYYEENLLQEEIGHRMGVTKARICQILKRINGRFRANGMPTPSHLKKRRTSTALHQLT